MFGEYDYYFIGRNRIGGDAFIAKFTTTDIEVNAINADVSLNISGTTLSPIRVANVPFELSEDELVNLVKDEEE